MKKLNKFISDAGYCSRREADKYIAEGRVTINGRDATLGSTVEEGDSVEVDGEKVGRAPKRAVYIAFNKPVGVSSTTNREDKSNVIDYINYKERIFHVGRLDKDSEGLLILTNDGDIVNKILRAGNNNPKEYIVTVDRPITPDFLEKMSKGVRILGVKTKPCKIVRKSDVSFVIYLTQGLNRQIRRMCHALNYNVVRLKRVKVMNITLGNLEPGQWRYFTPKEIQDMQELLKEAVGTEEASNERKAVAVKKKTAPRSGPAADSRKGSFSQYRKAGKKPGTSRSKGSPAPTRKRAK